MEGAHLSQSNISYGYTSNVHTHFPVFANPARFCVVNVHLAFFVCSLQNAFFEHFRRNDSGKRGVNGGRKGNLVCVEFTLFIWLMLRLVLVSNPII